MRRVVFLIIIFFILIFVLYVLFYKKAIVRTWPSEKIYLNQNNQLATSTLVLDNKIIEPMSQAVSRVTKKPFGIKISPSDSPVSPEKFSGYHTGVDFEILAGEENIAVPVQAICTGPLLLKKQATGYGGVAVQACEINKQAVTVVYGHLKLLSISAEVNQELKTGEQIGILGQGYSTETDGERKHLHLSVHLGPAVVLTGYVSRQSQLAAWLDPLPWFVQ